MRDLRVSDSGKPPQIKFGERLNNPLIRNKMGEVNRTEDEVSHAFINCPEVAGKTIDSLRLYPDSEGAVEILLEFADGTAFSCVVAHKPQVKGQLFRRGLDARRSSQSTTLRRL